LPKDRFAMPRIFAIHAHPDDIEFQCAGTLVLLKERGCEILTATMTPGDCGSAALLPDEIARVRRGEAAKSAELLGASYQCLEFRDLSICFDNDGRHKVAEALRRARPDIVLTAPPVDYMSDHEITCRLVRDACFNASVPNYSTRQWDPAPPMDKIPHLYYVDAIEGVDYYGNAVKPGFRKLPPVERNAGQGNRRGVWRSLHPAQRASISARQLALETARKCLGSQPFPRETLGLRIICPEKEWRPKDWRANHFRADA
jgi:hypothetical protein